MDDIFAVDRQRFTYLFFHVRCISHSVDEFLIAELRRLFKLMNVFGKVGHATKCNLPTIGEPSIITRARGGSLLYNKSRTQ